MKIVEVKANNRKKAFEVRARHKALAFPYALCNPSPSTEDRVEDVFVDRELGREAFTYTLASGAEGSVHMDAVLEHNEDPTVLAELAIYGLTIEARARFEESALSARDVARRLGTSAAQLYRLLDPTNYSKSMRQLLGLFQVLGFDIGFDVTPAAPRSVEERRRRAIVRLTREAEELGLEY